MKVKRTKINKIEQTPNEANRRESQDTFQAQISELQKKYNLNKPEVYEKRIEEMNIANKENIKEIKDTYVRPWKYIPGVHNPEDDSE